MTPLHFTAILSLATTSLAQATQQVTWAVVSYTYHGEKTPSLFPAPYDLTPVGAHQAYSAGQLIRERYISSSPNGSQLTSLVPVNGINQNPIDNSQLYMLSAYNPWTSASAQAFMQGVYPPRDALLINLESELGNSSIAQYPLDGYQYANIQAVGPLDFNSIYIAGNDGCNKYDVLNAQSLYSQSYVQKMQATSDFYQSLKSSVFWNFQESDLNYGNAWTLYEYANFEYQHNTSIYNSEVFTKDDLAMLYTLASAQQWDFNTPDANGTLKAVAGRTLASSVLQQFSHTIAAHGVGVEKMTFMFGSFEPMLSFFALSNLATGQSSARFNSLPLHGSTMIFELFSYATPSAAKNTSIPFPERSDLWVRFLFRNGTSVTDPLVQYPLFGRGLSEDDMPWNEFVTDMGDFSLDDVTDWCLECDSGYLFCEALLANYSNGTSPAGLNGGNSSGKNLSPAVSGVIGATVTIGLAILVGLILALVGFRIEHHPRNKGVIGGDIGVLRRSGSATGGGFKGAEKLASDTDLTMKGGAGATVVRHERIGSWELNDGPTAKDIESARSANYARRSEDGIRHVDPYGEPVKARDHI